MIKPSRLTAAHRHGFVAWLVEGGATIQPPKVANEYVRFVKPTGKSYTIMAQKNGDAYIAGGEAARLADDYLAGMEVRWAKDAPYVLRGGNSPLAHNRIVRELSLRDGWGCMYCGKVLTASTATIEHVVPKSMDGPNNMHNMVLTCWECNQKAGALSVADKIKLMHKHVGKAKGVISVSGVRNTTIWYKPDKGVEHDFPNAKIISKPDKKGKPEKYRTTLMLLVLFAVFLVPICAAVLNK